MNSINAERNPIWDSLENTKANKLLNEDRAFHDWYRFVLSFPPHLVRGYIDDFKLNKGSTLLDPFSGTGTTLVEGKMQGIRSMGIEANPMAHFAASTKVKWNICAKNLVENAELIFLNSEKQLADQGILDGFNLESTFAPLRSLKEESYNLLLTDSISELPLHKSLVLLENIRALAEPKLINHLLLAFAKTIVFNSSNLKFGPEVGIGKIEPNKQVLYPWFSEVKKIANDLHSLNSNEYPESKCLLGDARQLQKEIPPNSIDAVITSPPYPNEKDYSRTTRLESVILGFIKDKKELQLVKKSFVRSNTRSVYKHDDDDNFISEISSIKTLSDSIENRRIALGKTSGFEKLYAKVTTLYFGGMARHLISVSKLLKPGAMLAYVVGDQASYFQILIPTGQILAEIAKKSGFEFVRTDLFRTRFATSTRQELREEVVILRWKGK